jgi:hypothetical protein
MRQREFIAGKENNHFNGHPDLVVKGRYANDAVAAGVDGMEFKSTRKRACYVEVISGIISNWPKSSSDMFTEIYIAHLVEADFRKNAGGELGTRTATLGLARGYRPQILNRAMEARDESDRIRDF